jgi:hypothetical protein
MNTLLDSDLTTQPTVQTGEVRFVAPGVYAHGPQADRTIATIAAELHASMEAARRIKALREELHTALGRRPRGPRKAK